MEQRFLFFLCLFTFKKRHNNHEEHLIKPATDPRYWDLSHYRKILNVRHSVKQSTQRFYQLSSLYYSFIYQLH